MMSRVQGVGYFFLMLISVTILVACGSVQHQVSLDEKFAVAPTPKIFFLFHENLQRNRLDSMITKMPRGNDNSFV